MDKKPTNQIPNIDKDKTSEEVNLNNDESILVKTEPKELPLENLQQTDSKIKPLINEEDVLQNKLIDGQTEEFNYYKNKEEVSKKQLKEQMLLEAKVIEKKSNLQEDIEKLKKQIIEAKRKKIDVVDNLVLFDRETSKRILNKKKYLDKIRDKRLHSQQAKIQKHQEITLNKIEKKANKIEHQRIMAKEHVEECKITSDGIALTNHELKHKYATEAKKYKQEVKQKEQAKLKGQDRPNTKSLTKDKKENKKELSFDSNKKTPSAISLKHETNNPSPKTKEKPPKTKKNN